MTNIKDVLGRVVPVKAEATVCLDGDLVLERDRLQAALDALDGWERSSLSDADPREPLKAEMAALEARMREASQTFVFASIGDKASSDLLAAHPSPKDENGREQYAFDPQTYPAALVAAAAVDPAMEVEDAQALFDLLNLDQRNRLFSAAFSANNRSVDIPFLSPASDPAGDTDPR